MRECLAPGKLSYRKLANRPANAIQGSCNRIFGTSLCPSMQTVRIAAAQQPEYREDIAAALRCILDMAAEAKGRSTGLLDVRCWAACRWVMWRERGAF
ncbi:MAG: hypothetical protein JWP26_2279 [Devosia sp.]|nr:hypothetical protein [Devosia sp.]